MKKQYFGIVFSISLIAQPMMAAHMSVIEWKGTPQQSMGDLLLPNRKGFAKITQLSQNIVKGDTAGAQKLIDAQANNQSRASFVNSYGSDPYKVTPLHYAAGKGNDNLINMLLTAGANPNAQDSSQCTPLMWAISNGKDKAATLLASKTDLTIRDNLGRTALHWAAAKVNQVVATTLLSQGAAVRAKDNQGNTPLHYAVSVKYRFGKHDPQDDSGAAMSGKFVQAATIATAGMQPTQQNQAIMNKAINLGIATPVAGVASFAGGKGSGVVILTPNAQGTGVNAIGMPVSDTANPTPISPDVATIVNSSQASPTQVLQAAGGASARQNASGVAAQANAYQALSNVYASMSQMSLTQYTSAVQQLQSAMGSSGSISSHIDIDAIEVNTQIGAPPLRPSIRPKKPTTAKSGAGAEYTQPSELKSALKQGSNITIKQVQFADNEPATAEGEGPRDLTLMDVRENYANAPSSGVTSVKPARPPMSTQMLQEQLPFAGEENLPTATPMQAESGVAAQSGSQASRFTGTMLQPYPEDLEGAINKGHQVVAQHAQQLTAGKTAQKVPTYEDWRYENQSQQFHRTASNPSLEKQYQVEYPMQEPAMPSEVPSGAAVSSVSEAGSSVEGALTQQEWYRQLPQNAKNLYATPEQRGLAYEEYLQRYQLQQALPFAGEETLPTVKPTFQEWYNQQPQNYKRTALNPASDYQEEMKVQFPESGAGAQAKMESVRPQISTPESRVVPAAKSEAPSRAKPVFGSEADQELLNKQQMVKSGQQIVEPRGMTKAVSAGEKGQASLGSPKEGYKGAYQGPGELNMEPTPAKPVFGSEEDKALLNQLEKAGSKSTPPPKPPRSTRMLQEQLPFAREETLPGTEVMTPTEWYAQLPQNAKRLYATEEQLGSAYEKYLGKMGVSKSTPPPKPPRSPKMLQEQQARAQMKQTKMSVEAPAPKPTQFNLNLETGKFFNTGDNLANFKAAASAAGRESNWSIIPDYNALQNEIFQVEAMPRSGASVTYLNALKTASSQIEEAATPVQPSTLDNFMQFIRDAYLNAKGNVTQFMKSVQSKIASDPGSVGLSADEASTSFFTNFMSSLKQLALKAQGNVDGFMNGVQNQMKVLAQKLGKPAPATPTYGEYTTTKMTPSAKSIQQMSEENAWENEPSTSMTAEEEQGFRAWYAKQTNNYTTNVGSNLDQARAGYAAEVKPTTPIEMTQQYKLPQEIPFASESAQAAPEIAASEADTSVGNWKNLYKIYQQSFSKLTPGAQEVIAADVKNTIESTKVSGSSLTQVQALMQNASDAAKQQFASLKGEVTSLSKSSVNPNLVTTVEMEELPKGTEFPPPAEIKPTLTGTTPSVENPFPVTAEVGGAPGVESAAAATTATQAAETVAKPGVIGQVAGYLDQVALDAWKAIPSGVIKGGMEAAARLVSQAASTVMSAASKAATAAAEQAGNAFFGALTEAGVSLTTQGAIYGAGEAAGQALGTTVGELTGIASTDGTILASFAGLGVVDAVMILGMALQMAIQYGMQAQEKTDQRNKRAEIDGRRDNIIAALLKKDTKTITNNNNPYVSDFPAYLTANSKGRVPSHFAAMSGNSGPQQAINKLVNDPTVLTVVDNAGYTPLMYAIMRGRKDNLKPSGLSNVMLAQGFTRNANAMGTKTALGSFVNPMNITPLKTSLMFGGGKLFDAIFTIVHTSDVYTDTVGRNILHYAALDGKQIEKVYKAYSSVPWYTCLVSSTSSQTGPYRKMDPKANPWVTSQDMYGATPLHYAAATSANGFKFLLAKAGKVDLTTLLDKNGLTVLHYAAMCGRVEVIHEAMKHAGNKKKRDAFGEIKSKTTDTYGNAITPNLADKTAIDLASISGHPQAVRVLAKHVAESKKEKKGLLKGAKQSKRATAQQTKQQEKVSKGQSRVTKLQRREAKSKVMIDPLIAGVKAGRGNVVLAYNQPSNLTATESGTGMTALMYAVKEGREQMVKQILDALSQQKLTAQVLAMTDAKGQTASAMTKNKKIQAMLTQAASPTVAGGAVTGAPTPTTTKGKKATKAKNATSVIGKKTTNLPMNQR